MKTVTYGCDYLDGIEQLCGEPAHRQISTRAKAGNMAANVRVRHVCSDPHHIGVLVDEAMYSDEEVAKEAQEQHPNEHNEWKSTRVVNVVEIHDAPTD